MADEMIHIPIRSALIPIFYQNFQCLAQDCKDSCCAGWSITFNKKDYLALRRLDLPEDLRERLEKGLRREKKKAHDGILYAKFDLGANNDGHCPLLEPNGLCALQKAGFGEALPYVCKSYPRKVFYTPAAKEHTLSPSCEGVLQLLWDLPEGVEFVEDPLPKAEWRTANIPPEEAFKQFFAPIRALCIDILQTRSLSLTQRMLYLGVILQRLQNEDWNAFDPEQWTQQAAALVNAGAGPEVQGNREMYVQQNLRVLGAISTSTKGWPDEISAALGAKLQLTVLGQEGDFSRAELTTEYSAKAYQEALERFQTAFPDREYFFENLMVAAALYMNFPHLSGKDALWKSYMALCSLYSFYRFVSVLGCKEEDTKERLIHILALSSRAILHNGARFNGFQEELFQHDSSTLAHMAILLSG